MTGLTVKPHDFACSCGADGAARCEAVMAWALDFLSNDYRKVTRENLLTAAVYNLGWGYNAEITGIPNDQWSAVVTRTYTGKMVEGEWVLDHPPEFSTYIQCDRVEDGIAFTVRAYYDRYGDKREGSDE